MNRRKFFGAAVAGLSGLTIFPRKSESSQLEEGLSHEQMAQVILKHPHSVYLSGNARSFGKSRLSDGDEWDDWGDAVCGDHIHEAFTRNDFQWRRSVTGCVVRMDLYNLNSSRLTTERLFDISNPLLRVICLAGTLTGDNKATIGRQFACLQGKWVEL